MRRRRSRASSCCSKASATSRGSSTTFAPPRTTSTCCSTRSGPVATADAFVDALADRAAAGLEVQVAVDAIGSGVDFVSRGLYRRLRDAGAEIVANDGIAIVRGGRIGARSIRFHAEDALHFDHRKMMVIDGRDRLCRWDWHRGPLRRWPVHRRDVPRDGAGRRPGPAGVPDELGQGWRTTTAGPCRPVPRRRRRRPGPQRSRASGQPDDERSGTGHYPIREAILGALADAREVVDIVNPYIANPTVIRGFLDAARRGVRVRVVIPSEPRPPFPMAAFRGWSRSCSGRA